MTDVPVRTRRPRAERPAPDWEQVYRRNYLERLKRDRPPVDARSELPDLVARGYEDIAEEDLVRLHWWGLAHDKPKVGSFMVRVKVAGGRVTADQLRGLGRIARTYGRDEVELTTRQGVQLHWVPTATLSEVLEAVEAIGLRTAAAEGDTVRNITGCPVAGIGREELFDTGPVLRALADFFDGDFDGRRDYVNLPRKHKYTVSACPAQCNAPEIADVALVGTVQDGLPGFALRVGGGLANTPRFSRDLGVFVPVEEAVEVVRAVTDAWQTDLRYRMSRARARIKFMMDDYGPEGMRALVEAQLGRPLADGRAPVPLGATDHMGVHPQRQPGLVHLGVPVAAGRVAGSTLEAVADLLEDAGGEVRFTRQQNLVVGNVPAASVPRVVDGLADLGLPVDRGRTFARSVACTSQRFCNYSVARTKDKLQELLERLETRFGSEAIESLTVHLDGCPHACAQHWIGEIGLQGTTTHLSGSDRRVEAYDLSVGGGLGTRTAVGRRLLRRVPTSDIGDVVERLVEAWLEERPTRPAPYLLGDFLNAHSDEELVAVATAAAAPANDRAPGGVTVRVPGPLQASVDGADEVVVEAATVGEALACIGRRFPDFEATVLPDGDVHRSFLVTVADDDIRNLAGLATPVVAGDVVGIVMAMAGG